MQDTLWKMMTEELDFAAVREIESWLDGELDFVDVGYGLLSIESYDGMQGGRSRSFRLRHEKHGDQVVSRAALMTVLNDLAHALRPTANHGGPDSN